MESVEAKLKELGLELPPPPEPGGNYLPYRRHGDMLILAGVIAIRNGEMTHTGAVGKEQTVDSGYEAARVCALNALAGIKGALGSFGKVSRFLYMSGYVNATAGFPQSPQVINGASDLFAELFGEKGKHARAAVAVAGLPKDSTVEIQLTVEVA